MLQLKHLKKIYNRTEVLKDIDYHFEEGGIYPILGGNGAGRTTLFECICGELSLDGGEVVTKDKGVLFLAAKQSVLPMYITGYEFIHYLCELIGDKTQPQDYLEQACISEEKGNQLICDYSFEDKKRLQLAAFLAQKPYVIMFDEPFDYCTESYVNEFIDVLRKVQKDHIILISTGELSIAKKISSDILMLEDGELHFIEKDVMQMPEIADAVSTILEEADNDNI